APEGLLHAAVLERVVGEDREPPARTEDRPAPGEEPVELAELVVHRDADRLEGARRGVKARPRTARDGGDRAHEVGGGRERARAEIDGHRVGAGPAELGENRRELSEPGVTEDDAIPRRAEPIAGVRERLRVAIEAEEPASRSSREERGRVPPEADRRIHQKGT